MRKLILIPALLLSLAITSYSGVAGGSNWPVKVGVTSKDRGLALASDSAGNTYVTGYTVGAFSGYTNAGGRDMYVIKVDPNGAVLWTRQVGTSGHDMGMGIAVGPDGSVYVSGYSYNGVMWKLNGSTGAVKKTTRYGTNASEVTIFYNLAMGKNGALCAVGQIQSASTETGLVACYNQGLTLTVDRRMHAFDFCGGVAIADNGKVAVSCSERADSSNLWEDSPALDCCVDGSTILALSSDLDLLFKEAFEFFNAINQLFWFGNNRIVGVSNDGVPVTGKGSKVDYPDGTFRVVAAIAYDKTLVFGIQESPDAGKTINVALYFVPMSEIINYDPSADLWKRNAGYKVLFDKGRDIRGIQPPRGCCLPRNQTLVLDNPGDKIPVGTAVPELQPMVFIGPG